jgi:hypothetical protein
VLRGGSRLQRTTKTKIHCSGEKNSSSESRVRAVALNEHELRVVAKDVLGYAEHGESCDHLGPNAHQFG